MKSVTLDARGLMCPEPIKIAEQQLRQMDAGSLLKVQATDAASPIDFEVYCLQKGHQYLNCTDTGEWLEISLKKGTKK